MKLPNIIINFKIDGKSTAVSWCACYGDMAAHSFNKFFTDAKAQARAFFLNAGNAEVFIKDPLLVAWGNAGAGICDFQ